MLLRHPKRRTEDVMDEHHRKDAHLSIASSKTDENKPYFMKATIRDRGTDESRVEGKGVE